MIRARLYLATSLVMFASAAQAAVHQVKIEGASFQPATLELKKGDTVEWTNDDPVPHTVTGKGFKSGTIESGGTYKYTANKKGKLDYKCDLHVDMKGELVVK